MADMLTLDTNLLHEYWKQRAKAHHVERLLELNEQGNVHLAVTPRVHDDIPLDGLLAARLEKLPELQIFITADLFRADISAADGRDMAGRDDFMSFWPKACELAQQRVGRRRIPNWKDWDHLHIHLLTRRDFFLTWDTGILCLASELKSMFSVIVMPPEDYLARLVVDH